MKPNVLQFICPTGYYGAERWITALLKSMDKQQFDSHLCITLEEDSATDVIEHCEPHCVKLHTIPMSSKFDLSVVKKLVSTIKEHNIHIIHTHGYKSDIIGAIAGKMTGIKTVCTPHGFENTKEFKLRSYMWLGGKAFHFFDVVCPLSPQIQTDLITRYKVNQNKIRLINNGVDLSEIKAAQTTINKDAQSQPFTIGYIGQLISRKNLPAMLDAFSTFKTTHPDAKLVLVGDGEERNALENQCGLLKITENVSFLGFRDDRLDLLPTFDAFALTSSLEGIPRCLMEAMAAKVCVTAFDIPGVDQLIKHNQTGLSAPFNDTAALAQLWQTLAEDDHLKRQLASAGKDYVETHYSANAMAASYQQLYQELLFKKAEQHA